MRKFGISRCVGISHMSFSTRSVESNEEAPSEPPEPAPMIVLSVLVLSSRMRKQSRSDLTRCGQITFSTRSVESNEEALDK